MATASSWSSGLPVTELPDKKIRSFQDDQQGDRGEAEQERHGLREQAVGPRPNGGDPMHADISQHNRRRGLVAAVLLAALVVATAACGDDDDTTSSSETPATTSSASVDVVITGDGFDVSGPLRPGGTVRVRNDDDQMHMMLLARLRDGQTMDDFRTALESDEETAVDAVVEPVGAPSTHLPPGQSLEISDAGLREGTYALADFQPAEGGDGTPIVFTTGPGELVVTGDAEPRKRDEAKGQRGSTRAVPPGPV